MKPRIKLIGISLLFVAILYSCTDDYFEFDKVKFDDWRPELAIPLVNSSLTLEELILNKDSNRIIQEDPNTGILEVSYEGSVFTLSGEELITLPNQSMNQLINGISIPSTGPNQVTANRSFDFTYNIGAGIEVDSLLLKGGDLRLTFESKFQHNLDITLNLPGFKNSSGQSLSQNFSMPPSNGSTVVARSAIISLNGYTLDMTKGGSTVNNIEANVTITLTRVDGNPSSPTDELEFTAQLTNLSFKEFSGYVGQRDLELDIDTIPINLFNNFKNGTFFLSNPFLDITIQSGYGVPVNLGFQELKARNIDRNPNEININLPQNPIQLNSPPRNQVAETKLQLVNTNSNIDTVISFLLKEIIYDAVANFNPNGQPGPGQPRNFVSDESKIGLDVFLRLPFEGHASGFQLVDTIDFNFEVADELDNGLIRVIAENTFPIDAAFQVVFVDSAYNRIDSLYRPDAQNPGALRSIVPASITDANGETIQSSRKLTDVEVNTTRLKELSKGRYAIILAELETVNAPNQVVRFLPEYQLDISLGLKARILID
jgi:hypothetical protein